MYRSILTLSAVAAFATSVQANELPSHQMQLNNVDLQMNTSAKNMHQYGTQQSYKKEETKKLELSVGIGAVSLPSYLGSDDQKTYVLPFADVKYKLSDNDTLFANPLRGVGYERRLSPVLRAGIAGTVRQPRNSDNKRLLEGMDNIDGTLEVGPYIERQLSRKLSVGASAKFDTMGVHSSFTADVYANYQLPTFVKNLYTTATLSLSYYGNKFVETYYSVDASDVTATRPEFDGDGGFGEASVGINSMYYIDDKWFVVGGFNYKRLMDEVENSPVNAQNDNFTAILGLGYRLY